MNVTNNSLQIRHVGGVLLLPGETKPLPKEVTSNEKTMRHIMKDVEAKILEVGEPTEEESKDDSKKQTGRAAGGKPTEEESKDDSKKQTGRAAGGKPAEQK